MAKVTNNEIFDNSLFQTEIDKAKKLVIVLDEVEKGFIDVAKAQQKIVNSGNSKTIQDIQKTKAAIKELSTVEQAQIKVKKQKQALEVQLKVANSEANRQNVQTKLQIQEQIRSVRELEKQKLKSLGVIKKTTAELNKETKAAERNKKIALDNANAYKVLTKSVNSAQAKFKMLAAQYGETDRRTLGALKTFSKLDNKLRKINNTARDGRRDVGRYGLALNKIKGAFGSVAGALGLTAGIAGLGRVLSSTINIFTSFEKANSNLQAVLGVTKIEMTSLTDEAKRLGSITSFTAAEVTGLQTSFAKLGFPISDINQMTESTLNAAAAMGSGLDETAALTGATLKAFGLDASEAGRVNDVLAKSTAASALDFSKLNSAMSTIAPVANSFGFSVEESTALLGQLSNAGFDASSAATSTKNILLNLADSNGKLAKSLKEPVTDLPSLVKGLKQLKSEGIDLGEALKLTDKRSVAAFQTFLEGSDSLLDLNEKLENAGGTAQAMADTQLDNLSGSVTILNSAWEGFILSLEDGNGAFSRTLRNIVEVATEILSLLTGTEKLNSEMTDHERTVRKYAKSFISVVKIVSSLAVAFVTYKAVIFSTNIATKAYTAATTALRIAKIALSGGIGKATKAMKAFNLASKANPLGIIIALLALAVTAWIAFSDGVSESVKAMDNFNKASKKAQENQNQNINERKKGVGEIVKAEELRVRKLIALGGDEKKLNTELSEFKKDILKKEKVSEEERLSDGIKTSNKKIALNKKELNQIDADIEKASKNIGQSGRENGDAIALAKISKLSTRRSKLIQENAEFAGLVDGTVKAIRDNILAIDNEIAEADVALLEVIQDNTGKTKSEFGKRAKELDLLRRRLEDLNNQAIKDDLERQKTIVNTKFRREIETIKGNSKVEIELRIALRLARDTELLKLDDDFNKKKQDKEDDFNKRRNERLDKEELRATEDPVQKAVLAEMHKFDKEVEEIENNELLRKKEKDALILQRAKETQDAISKIEQDAANEKLEIDKKNDDDREALLQKEKDAQKELMNTVAEGVQFIGELIDQAFDRRIEGISEQLNKTGENINRLRGKAQEGRLESEESLAFEQKKEIELARQKETEQKRQEKTKALFAILSSFNANDGNLPKTIADISVLKALASGLTAFDGVDDTGSRGNIDSKGGKLWTLHPNEQVWSKKDRGDVGFRNRDEIKDIVGMYDNGFMMDALNHDSADFMNKSSFVLNGMSTGKIESKLDDINRGINGIVIPENHFDYDLIRNIFEHRVKKGNRTTIKHSKLF